MVVSVELVLPDAVTARAEAEAADAHWVAPIGPSLTELGEVFPLLLIAQGEIHRGGHPARRQVLMREVLGVLGIKQLPEALEFSILLKHTKQLLRELFLVFFVRAFQHCIIVQPDSVAHEIVLLTLDELGQEVSVEFIDLKSVADFQDALIQALREPIQNSELLLELLHIPLFPHATLLHTPVNLDEVVRLLNGGESTESRHRGVIPSVVDHEGGLVEGDLLRDNDLNLFTIFLLECLAILFWVQLVVKIYRREDLVDL